MCKKTKKGLKNVVESMETTTDIDLLNCPFCGSEAEHESTITEEVIRCTLCPATMYYDGSGDAVKAMWNARAKIPGPTGNEDG